MAKITPLPGEAKKKSKLTSKAANGILSVTKRFVRWLSLVILVALAYEGVTKLVSANPNIVTAFAITVVGLLTYAHLVD